MANEKMNDLQAFMWFRPEFFLLVDLQTLNPTVIFRNEKKLFLKLFFFILSADSINIICFVEKNIFMWFCLCTCTFKSDTVKNYCPVQIFRKMMKYLIQTVGLPYYFYCFFLKI